MPIETEGNTGTGMANAYDDAETILLVGKQVIQKITIVISTVGIELYADQGDAIAQQLDNIHMETSEKVDVTWIRLLARERDLIALAG